MATKARKHADEDQITAVADWILDCEQTFACKVRVILNGTFPARRVAIRVQACDTSGERLVGVRVQRSTAYPNSSATSLCGVILKELMLLHKDLDDYQALCDGRNANSGPPDGNSA